MRQIKVQKPSVLPWYGMGVVWLLGGLVLPLYQLWAILLTAGLGLGAFAVLQKLCPPRELVQEVSFHTGVDDVDEMLESIEQLLKKLRLLNEKIPDTGLSASISRMEKAGAGVVSVVERQPDKAKQIRRFANYYLPDAVKVLEQYAALEEQDVRGENSAAVRREVEANAASIATAFENQLDALFSAESLDISADLEVLQGMLKGEGFGDGVHR